MSELISYHCHSTSLQLAWWEQLWIHFAKMATTTQWLYLTVLETVCHGSLVILDPVGHEVGGAVQDALDDGQLVHRRHRLLQEVAAPGNASSAASYRFFELGCLIVQSIVL